MEAKKENHSRFFVFQADIQSEDVCILYAFWHVRVPCTVIENKTANKLRLGRGAMLHLHYFNHMQVYGLPELFFWIYV